MSSLPDIFPSFSSMLRSALGDLLAPDAHSFLDMVADDFVMEFPYAPPSGVPRLEGKAALADYLPGVARLVTIDSMSAPVVYRTTTPGVVILEFSSKGRGNETGRAYEQNYISVVTVRDGRIAHYRDYWNPLILSDVTGRDGQTALALKGARSG